MKKLCDISLLFVAIFLIIFASSDGKISESLKVTLSHGGGIIGRYLRSFNGRGICAFMGIPYAEPPIGKLRFKNPVAKSPWNGYLETVSSEIMCPQKKLFDRVLSIAGNEDCLYLNVYVPQFPDTKPLPVMVYFHGGGWFTDYAGFYNPDFFLDHDVILVTGTYRLGALGFLTTNTSDSPGNFGLKDQVEILKWVQQNIQAFGGNPEQVTIFGESAGAASVTYLMSVSATKGLFHRAIAQSGNYLNNWAFLEPARAIKRTEKFATAIGCSLDNENAWGKLVECLRGKSVVDLVEYASVLNEWDSDPVVKFPPTIEHDEKDGIIGEHPKNIKENHGLKIPLLIGLTRDEGVVRSLEIKSVPRLVDDLHEKWDEILPIILSYTEMDAVKQMEITKAVTDFYFGGKRGKEAMEMTQNFTNMCTDFMFFKGFNDYLQQRFNGQETAPTFLYLFSHRGDGTFADAYFGIREEDHGVCHTDDIIYLFPILDKSMFRAAPSQEDIFMQNNLVKLWVNFATSGNPTPVDKLDVTWTPADKFPLDYLRIGNYKNPSQPIFAMERGFWTERQVFLNRVFK
ncbi:hypothetical protein DMENIID0001_063670 [Sergentomyia squamirostris]